MNNVLPLRLIAFCLSLVLMCTGCITHERVDPVIKVPRFYAYRSEHEGLHIVGDPYITKSKSGLYFNKDLRNQGIYPVHLILNNMGEKVYDISSVLITLSNESAHVLRPMPYEVVTKKVLKKTATKMVAYGALGSVFLILTVPFAVTAGISSYRSNKIIREDMQTKRMNPNYIVPGEVRHGFIFFDLFPENRTIDRDVFLQQFVLTIEDLRDVAADSSFDVSVVMG